MDRTLLPGALRPRRMEACYTNSSGEEFTYTEAADMPRLMNADGDAFAILDGGFLFGGNSYLYGPLEV